MLSVQHHKLFLSIVASVMAQSWKELDWSIHTCIKESFGGCFKAHLGRFDNRIQSSQIEHLRPLYSSYPSASVNKSVGVNDMYGTRESL